MNAVPPDRLAADCPTCRPAAGDAAWLLLLAAALLPAALPAVAEALAYDRAQIAGGQWWRLASGHWVHFSAGHLWPDLAACTVLGLALPRLGAGSPVAFALFAAPFIGGFIHLAEPAMLRYGGLSGIAFGLAGLLALTVAAARPRSGDWRTPTPARLLPAALLAAVVLLQLWQDPRPIATGVLAAPHAHLGGLLAALAWHAGRRVAGRVLQ